MGDTTAGAGGAALITTVMVVVVAHWPVLGVKVYVVVVVLLIAGLQVPVIPFVEVVGNVNDPPLHNAATWLKAGVVLGLTTTVMVVVVTQLPPGTVVGRGVNV